MDRGHLRFIWEKSMFFLKINITSKKSIGVPGTRGTPPGSVPVYKTKCNKDTSETTFTTAASCDNSLCLYNQRHPNLV